MLSIGWEWYYRDKEPQTQTYTKLLPSPPEKDAGVHTGLKIYAVLSSALAQAVHGRVGYLSLIPWGIWLSTFINKEYAH
jgi:hypothetical protein